MTQPVQEPTSGRTTSGLGYGQRQLFRRPALPTESGGGVEVVHMFDWDTDGTANVPNTTWTNPCSLGGSDGFFQSVFYTDAFSVAWDCNTGTITKSTIGEYLIQGWVQFNEDASAGEQRFVSLNFGSSNRHIQEYVAVSASTTLLANHLPVHTFRFAGITVFMEVWHNHGSNLTIRGAELSVKMFALATAGVVDDECAA